MSYLEQPAPERLTITAWKSVLFQNVSIDKLGLGAGMSWGRVYLE